MITMILFSLIPPLAIIGGALLTEIYRPKPKIISSFQHFAAGIILGAVSIEILPRIVNSSGIITSALGFILGVLFMLFLEKLSDWIKGMSTSSYGLIISSYIDQLIDGLLLGIVFLASIKTGSVIAISLSFCSLFLSVSVSLSLKKGKKKILLVSIFMALIFLIGVFLGYFALSLLSSIWMTEILSFGLAALLYLSIEELLLRAHEQKCSIWISSFFFLGFLVILLFRF